MLTPAFNHLLRFDFVGCAEKVSKLINRPVVCLFGTQVRGTRAKVVPYLGLRGRSEISCNHKPQRLLRNHWDLSAHGRGKECLSETSRPGFISTVSPDLPQPTHRLEEEDTLRVILFLRLKDTNLRPKYRVLNGSHYALL